MNGDRLLGEEAAAVAARVPDLALGQLRDFLGVQAASPGVQSLLAEQHLPWKVVPVKGRGTVAFQLGKGDPVTIEEAVVGFLSPLSICREYTGSCDPCVRNGEGLMSCGSLTNQGKYGLGLRFRFANTACRWGQKRLP